MRDGTSIDYYDGFATSPEAEATHAANPPTPTVCACEMAKPPCFVSHNLKYPY